MISWGNNSFGQLGNDSLSLSRTPVETAPVSAVTFTDLASGGDHSVALGDDSRAYAWGRNNDGQLGNGSTTRSTTPSAVKQPSGVTFTTISAGGAHTTALGDDGNIYSWGYNSYGQLGDNTTTRSTTPVKTTTPPDVAFTHIDAGTNHTVALGNDGNAYAWGRNNDGQLGNGSTTQSKIPTAVKQPSGVTFTAISAGGDLSVARTDNGVAYAWGRNNVGQLGNGSTSPSSSTPARVLTSRVFELVTPNLPEANIIENGAEFSGRGEPRTGVVLTATDNAVVGTAVVDDRGYWTVRLTELPEGPHTLSITATPPEGSTIRLGPFDIVVVPAGSATLHAVTLSTSGVIRGTTDRPYFRTLKKDGATWTPGTDTYQTRVAADGSFSDTQHLELGPGTYEYHVGVIGDLAAPISCHVEANDSHPLPYTRVPDSILADGNRPFFGYVQCSFVLE